VHLCEDLNFVAASVLQTWRGCQKFEWWPCAPYLDLLNVKSTGFGRQSRTTTVAVSSHFDQGISFYHANIHTHTYTHCDKVIAMSTLTTWYGDTDNHKQLYCNVLFRRKCTTKTYWTAGLFLVSMRICWPSSYTVPSYTSLPSTNRAE